MGKFLDEFRELQANLTKEARIKSYLLTDSAVQAAIDHPANAPIIQSIMALALEVREYRKIYGPLGCDWLSADEELNR